MPWLERDGVSLFYEDAGGDGPPVVLVHGLGCDHTFMAPQFTYFRGAHRVLALDLRGHGRSDKPRQSYTIPAFTDDLAWVCSELAVERPVVIGHSMGGAIALELAGERPEQLAGIVLLDTAVLPAPDVWAGIQPVLAGLHTPAYREVVRQFIADAFFLPTDDPQRKAWAIGAMLETPQQVLASALEGLFAWDSAEATARCRLPTLYIASTRSRGDLTRFRRACPQLVDGQVVGSGHFVQLEVPDQVNAMISRFLRMNREGGDRCKGPAGVSRR
jgi:pimeloyl-ACP methyl ester carboxylesterase